VLQVIEWNQVRAVHEKDVSLVGRGIPPQKSWLQSALLKVLGCSGENYLYEFNSVCGCCGIDAKAASNAI
jgi:hypothetical protein